MIIWRQMEYNSYLLRIQSLLSLPIYLLQRKKETLILVFILNHGHLITESAGESSLGGSLTTTLNLTGSPLVIGLPSFTKHKLPTIKKILGSACAEIAEKPTQFSTTSVCGHLHVLLITTSHSGSPPTTRPVFVTLAVIEDGLQRFAKPAYISHNLMRNSFA